MNTQDQIQIIKTKMPETYVAITVKAGGDASVVNGRAVVTKPGHNKAVYQLVRNGLAGTPNCFWAMEAGHVMGTPFNLPDLNRETAAAMVQFGCLYVCTFGPVPKGAIDGTH